MISNKVYLDKRLSFIDTIEYPSKSMYSCELSVSLYPHCVALPSLLSGLGNEDFTQGTFYVIHTFRRWMQRTIIVMIQIRPNEYLLFQGETLTIECDLPFPSPFYLYPIFFDPKRSDFYLLNGISFLFPFRTPTCRPDHLLESCKLENIYELMSHYNLMPVEAARLYMPTIEFVLTKSDNRRKQLRDCLSAGVNWQTNHYEQLDWYTY